MASVNKNRWLALGVLCLGTLMEVLDTTIVNVALPSIKNDLAFSESSLAWVVNAYLITFGGFLLLGGRLGDIFGHRKLFIMGIVIFTLASLGCGLANSQTALIIARTLQGLGGAVTSAVALSLMMDLFTKPDERARAMGIFGFVAAGGGSVGVLLGGVLTGAFNWHWIFLVNVPIGVLVCFLSLKILPISKTKGSVKNLDLLGAITITSSLLLQVFAIVNGNQAGWLSLQTIGLIGLATILMAVFFLIESRVHSPLIPISIFKIHNLIYANVIGILWAGAMFAWFFMSALYLQLVLGFKPLAVGLSFLPANLIMAIFSIWLSAKFVIKFGIKKPLTVGLSLAGLGLLLFVRAPVNGNFLIDVLPSMILLGFGAGMAFNPLFLVAMSDIGPQDSGLASGIVNTSFMMGGALGLAILASVAAFQTQNLLMQNQSQLTSLLGGYHAAFLLGGAFAILASLIAALLLNPKETLANVKA